MPVDRDRLRRALELDADPLPDGRWLISGGTVPRLVDETGCVCEDARFSGEECKHRLRVRLAALDADLLAGLRDLAGPEASPAAALGRPVRETTVSRTAAQRETRR